MSARRTAIAVGLGACALGIGAPAAQAQQDDAAVPEPALTAVVPAANPDFAERGGQPGGARYDGRLSLRDVFSVDSQTDNDIHILFADADFRGLDMARVADAKLNVRLESRFLLDFTQDEGLANTSLFTDEAGARQRNERRFGETQTVADVRSAFAELEGLGRFDLSAGRIWFFESGGAWVDGLAATFHFADQWGATLFGGLQPDPYSYGLTAARQTAGTFVAFEDRTASWSLGYTLDLLDGGIDRHFVSSRGHWAVPWTAVRGFFLSYYLTADLQTEASPQLTTAFANSSLWVNDTLNFGLNVARFSNIQYVRSHAETGGNFAEPNQRSLLGLDTNLGTYDQVRFSTAERFGGVYLYQQIDLRRRDTIAPGDATYYSVGVRDSDLLETGVFWHARLTVRNNFQSDSSELFVEVARQFGSTFELDGSVAFLTGRSQVAPQTQDVLVYDLRGVYNFSPALYFALDYELSQETNVVQEELETSGDLLVHTVFTRLTWRL